MKTKLIRSLPYLLIFLLDFYLLPFLIGDTGAAMLYLLFVIPSIVLITSLAYGMIRGFDPAAFHAETQAHRAEFGSYDEGRACETLANYLLNLL